MARKLRLFEYQRHLTERLRSTGQTASPTAMLGFKISQDRWLLPMQDASEVLPMPTLIPVPSTKPWFRGLANIRDVFFGIVDLSVFCGGMATPLGTESRVILMTSRLGAACGLLVTRMMGIKHLDQFCDQRTPDARPRWIVSEHVDGDGGHWTKLDVVQLLRDPDFQDAAL